MALDLSADRPDDARELTVSRRFPALGSSAPGESIEAFLARVGVPPRCQVELRPAGTVPSLSLGPTFDAHTRSWTWALTGERQVLASWQAGEQPMDALADEIVATARRLLPVVPGGQVVLTGRFGGSVPIERVEGETEEDYLREALEVCGAGRMIHVGSSGDEATPRAVVSEMGPDLVLRWNQLARRDGTPSFDRWRDRKPEAVAWLQREIRDALELPANQPLQAWSISWGMDTPELHVADVSGASLLPILAAPYRHGDAFFTSPALAADQLPTLRRSGPGSGIDEIEAPGGRAGATGPAMLHLLPGPFRTQPLQSWPAAEGSLEPTVIAEALASARLRLGIAPDAGLDAEVWAVDGPDAKLLSATREGLGCVPYMSAGVGAVVAAGCAIATGLLLAASDGVLGGLAVGGAALLAAVVSAGLVSAAAAPAGQRAADRLSALPTPSAFRRLEALGCLLEAGCFVAPIAAAIVTAIIVVAWAG